MRIHIVCFETEVIGFSFHRPTYRYIHIGLYIDLYIHDSSMYTHGKELGFGHSFTFYRCLGGFCYCVLPAKYFCPFPIRTFIVSLCNLFTVLSLDNTLLTLCLLIAIVWLHKKSDGSHLFKLTTQKVWELFWLWHFFQIQV